MSRTLKKKRNFSYLFFLFPLKNEINLAHVQGGETVLISGVHSKQVEIVQLLLNAGVSVNEKAMVNLYIHLSINISTVMSLSIKYQTYQHS